MNGRRNSFTLIELMLSFAITAIMLAVISLSFRGVVLAWRGMVRGTGNVEAAIRAERMADVLFCNLALFSYPDPDGGGERKMPELREESIFAVTRTRADSLESPGLLYFRLYLSDDGELMLESTTTPFFPDMKSAEMRLTREVVLSGVEEVSFSYGWFENGELEWVNEWSEENFLPSAVLMQVEFKNGDRDSWLRRVGGAQEYVKSEYCK